MKHHLLSSKNNTIDLFRYVGSALAFDRPVLGLFIRRIIMPENNYSKFTCPKCGSNKLAYQEYVKNITPAEFMSCGKLYYTPATINEDDFVPEARGFCCRDCGHKLTYCGHQVTTEKEVWDYFEELSHSPDKSNGVPGNEEYEASQEALDLIDKINIDWIVIRDTEEDK
jgi:predicted RNA-binding Zn-ribbon protein involved in translation (DUF1610 family)